MHQSNDIMKQWLAAYKIGPAVAVTLTHTSKGDGLRLNLGRMTTNQQSKYTILERDATYSKNFRLFLNLLNTKIFGRRYYKKHHGLGVIPVLERGHTGFHYHAILEFPSKYNMSDYRHMIENSWSRTPYGGKFTRITNSTDVHGWVGYMTKFRNMQDSVDYRNMNVSCWT